MIGGRQLTRIRMCLSASAVLSKPDKMGKGEGEGGREAELGSLVLLSWAQRLCWSWLSVKGRRPDFAHGRSSSWDTRSGILRTQKLRTPQKFSLESVE